MAGGGWRGRCGPAVGFRRVVVVVKAGVVLPLLGRMGGTVAQGMVRGRRVMEEGSTRTGFRRRWRLRCGAGLRAGGGAWSTACSG